jgi:hypothetical protein
MGAAEPFPDSNTSGPLATYPDLDHEFGAIPKPTSIAGRRNLRNFHMRMPATDFETWKQAEEALSHGVTVHELVRREFSRDFGDDAIWYGDPDYSLYI